MASHQRSGSSFDSGVRTSNLSFLTLSAMDAVHLIANCIVLVCLCRVSSNIQSFMISFIQSAFHIEALSQGSGDFSCGHNRRQHKEKLYLRSGNVLFGGLQKAGQMGASKRRGRWGPPASNSPSLGHFLDPPLINNTMCVLEPFMERVTRTGNGAEWTSGGYEFF